MDTEVFENRGVDVDMDTEFFENRGVDMDMDTEFLEKRGVDLDMDTVWNRCPPNSDGDVIAIYFKSAMRIHFNDYIIHLFKLWLLYIYLEPSQDFRNFRTRKA